MEVMEKSLARVRHVTGRLIEIEFRGTDVSHADAAVFIADFKRAQASAVKNPTNKTVCVVDSRGLRAVSHRLGSLMSRIIRLSNVTLERSASLTSVGPIFGIEVDRIVREGDNPNRRYFDDHDEAVEWLGEVLTAKERERLEAFVAAYDER